MYSDPGSGLLFIQLISVAVLTAIHRFRHGLWTFFRRLWPTRRIED